MTSTRGQSRRFWYLREKAERTEMTEQLIGLINHINSIEQQIRVLNDEKRVLEKDLDRFSIGDHGVRDLRVPNGK